VRLLKDIGKAPRAFKGASWGLAQQDRCFNGIATANNVSFSPENPVLFSGAGTDIVGYEKGQKAVYEHASRIHSMKKAMLRFSPHTSGGFECCHGKRDWAKFSTQ
jgi:hypothetical protein